MDATPCWVTLNISTAKHVQVCPGLASFRPQNCTPHLIHGSLSPLKSTFQMASGTVPPHSQGSWSWKTDKPTDHITPSVAIGHIYLVLWCGLIIYRQEKRVLDRSTLLWVPACKPLLPPILVLSSRTWWYSDECPFTINKLQWHLLSTIFATGRCFALSPAACTHTRTDCLEGKRKNYQVCSVQYCVQQLCTVQCTHIWTDLTVLWIGFCLTGPTSLCLD